MSKKIDITDKLDFSEMDLTAPNKVVEEILDQLPEVTQGIVLGSVVKYDGKVVSYKEENAIAGVLSMTSERHISIQNDLGKIGDEERKYECFLYTSNYSKYKYRMFFMSYGVANYPVLFTLEESIAKSILGKSSSYYLTCNNRSEVETLITEILASEKVINIMQELIRIHRAKEMEKIVEFSDIHNEQE